MAHERGAGRGGGEKETTDEEEDPPGGKRPLPSVHPRSPPDPVAPFKKKTRDLPNLCNCHRCGLRFPDKGRRQRLRPLRSQWRVVLLCEGCLREVRSAQVCSYCFVGFEGRGGGGFVSCRGCACRVHSGCLPLQRGYLAPSDLDPDLFVCVDCRAIPVSGVRKGVKLRDSSVAGVSVLDLENTGRNANAGDVKDVGDEEAAAAKNVADLVRGALDLVAVEELPACTAVPDEELALQLHRAMNGSQRISRNSCSTSSVGLTGDEGGLSDVNLLDKDPESGHYDSCGGVELCTEDNNYFGTMEILDAKPLNVFSFSEGDFVENLNEGRERYQSEEVTPCRKGDVTEMTAREEQACCTDKFMNSTEDKNSVDGVSASCPRAGGPNIATSQQDEKHSMPDRYMKKYCKRRFRTKDR